MHIKVVDLLDISVSQVMLISDQVAIPNHSSVYPYPVFLSSNEAVPKNKCSHSGSLLLYMTGVPFMKPKTRQGVVSADLIKLCVKFTEPLIELGSVFNILKADYKLLTTQQGRGPAERQNNAVIETSFTLLLGNFPCQSVSLVFLLRISRKKPSCLKHKIF